MLRTSVCLRHTRDSEELKKTDYHGYSIDIDDQDFEGLIADFISSNQLTDEVAASAVELIVDVAKMDDDKVGERENVAQSIACAVLRQNFINNFGAEKIGGGTITIMDETAVGGEVSVWVNDEGEAAKFYVTLGN